jgi:hypothetical protein
MCPMDDQHDLSRTGVLAEHHVIASTTTLLDTVYHHGRLLKYGALESRTWHPMVQLRPLQL